MVALKSPVAAILMLGLAVAVAQAQSKPRIAVYAFDDRTAATQGMNIGQKVADALIAKLAETGNFAVVDRNYLDQVRREQNLTLDPRFDGGAAVHIGKLANVQIIAVGQIDAFNANVTNATTHNPLENKETSTGTVALKVTVRLLDVSTGTILAAPVAENQQKSVLAHTSSSNVVRGLSSSRATTDTQQALLKLVDKSLAEVAVQITKQIEAANTPVAAPPLSAKVIGIDSGLVLINKGSAAGVRVKDSFEIFRRVDTKLKDPDTGAPVLRRERLCTMVVTEVESSFSSGKCGGTEQPISGDEAARAGEQN